jgi:eukaryotic-like serine/threonine-protein kinase
MSILRFGIFEVDSASGEFRKGGRRLRLREQPLRLLLALLDHGGHVVTREQLRQRLWPDATFVNFDRAINKAVSEARGDVCWCSRLPRVPQS